MNKEELKELLSGKSQEWRNGFFAAVNSSTEMKAVFLREFIGAKVEVVYAEIVDAVDE